MPVKAAGAQVGQLDDVEGAVTELPERKYSARKPSSMKAEPNSVNRKNLMAA